jgi:NAD+ synthase (glutamine-hydrolysing)
MKLHVALAQINPTVGDLASNTALKTKYTKDAVAVCVDIIVFPEMVLTG